jgi:hypothetical protein
LKKIEQFNFEITLLNQYKSTAKNTFPFINSLTRKIGYSFEKLKVFKVFVWAKLGNVGGNCQTSQRKFFIFFILSHKHLLGKVIFGCSLFKALHLTQI